MSRFEEVPRRAVSKIALLGLAAVVGAWSFGAGCSGDDSSSAPSGPPNIVVVMADDHALQAISAYSGMLNTTPNIDRLADEGIVFRHALVPNSICSPSRAALLTGTYSHRNGQFTNWELFDGSQDTFPQLLQRSGYQTALVGKWHLHSDPTGFEDWEVLDALAGQGTYYDASFESPDGQVVREGYVTDVITDRALEWLTLRRDASRPFLLMVQHKAPHRDWEPGPEQLDLFADVDLPEPPTLFDDYSGRATPASGQTMEIGQHLTPFDLKLIRPRGLPERNRAEWDAAYEPRNQELEQLMLEGDDLVRWKYQRYVKDYLRTIASVDDNLGRLLEYLDDAGLTENTVVIYTSDQGFFLGEHGWFDKRWMYEESLHTPLLLRWPARVAPGQVDEHLVSIIDLAPTLVDVAGGAIPAAMQGSSMLPILEGREPSEWRNSFYYHYYDYQFPPITFHDVQRHYGVRTERYKLIHYYLIDEWELFDLEVDPTEIRSVYDDPGFDEVRRDLELELARLRADLEVPDDPGPG